MIDRLSANTILHGTDGAALPTWGSVCALQRRCESSALVHAAERGPGPAVGQLWQRQDLATFYPHQLRWQSRRRGRLATQPTFRASQLRPAQEPIFVRDQAQSSQVSTITFVWLLDISRYNKINTHGFISTLIIIANLLLTQSQ